MVVSDAEMLTQSEVELPHSDRQQSHVAGEKHAAPDHQKGHGSSNFGFPNLGRQSSIYSLTLDEFQHTLCENGKSFGSMNMDEFLNSIWTAEENQAHQGQSNSSAVHLVSTGPVIGRQPSLARQGSLTLPAPLCRKTVDEVWSEIQRTHEPDDQHLQTQSRSHSQTQSQNQQQAGNPNSGTTQRQPTFGEMTLEDFLVKAGVVREQCGPTAIAPTPMVVPPPTVPPQHHQYGFTAGPHPPMGPAAFAARPMMTPTPAAYPGESSGYVAGNAKRNNGYPGPPATVCYGGRVSNGSAPPGLTGVNPVSPDGICGPGQVDNSGAGQYGMELAVLRGRKRIIDGPVEKVVERRQRRMIKNRESAARSRARKQAYTVELEAELNQLREENTQLKQALAEIERQRKQQYFDEQKAALTRAQRAQEKLRTMMRSRSWAL